LIALLNQFFGFCLPFESGGAIDGVEAEAGFPAFGGGQTLDCRI